MRSDVIIGLLMLPAALAGFLLVLYFNWRGRLMRGVWRSSSQAFVSLAGAAGVALLFPIGILAVGVPVALGVRGLLELAEWILAMAR